MFMRALWPLWGTPCTVPVAGVGAVHSRVVCTVSLCRIRSSCVNSFCLLAGPIVSLDCTPPLLRSAGGPFAVTPCRHYPAHLEHRHRHGPIVVVTFVVNRHGPCPCVLPRATATDGADAPACPSFVASDARSVLCCLWWW